MISSNFSLLKYNNPILVQRTTERKLSGQSNSQLTPTSSVISSTITSSETIVAGSPASSKKWLSSTSSTVETSDKSSSSETQEILDAILPPREWSHDGQFWKQHVSSIPATRTEVINLQEQLDTKLQQRQARETGICPVRRELYSQCFDELIRQVAINCAERGLLLLRVRDEINMTVAAYQTLYESSIAFGMRKALQAEKGRADMENKIRDLEQVANELENQLADLKAKYEQSERRANEQRETAERKHADELQFFRKTNEQLKAQLEGIISSKK